MTHRPRPGGGRTAPDEAPIYGFGLFELDAFACEAVVLPRFELAFDGVEAPENILALGKMGGGGGVAMPLIIILLLLLIPGKCGGGGSPIAANPEREKF